MHPLAHPAHATTKVGVRRRDAEGHRVGRRIEGDPFDRVGDLGRHALREFEHRPHLREPPPAARDRRTARGCRQAIVRPRAACSRSRGALPFRRTHRARAGTCGDAPQGHDSTDAPCSPSHSSSTAAWLTRRARGVPRPRDSGRAPRGNVPRTPRIARGGGAIRCAGRGRARHPSPTRRARPVPCAPRAARAGRPAPGSRRMPRRVRRRASA